MRLLLVLLCACLVGAAESAVPSPVLPSGVAVDQGEMPSPGRETPVAAVPQMALRFSWGENGEDTTVVVIGEGVGITRPAWVATWEDSVVAEPGGENPNPKKKRGLAVVYRATAFYDARGRLHIDSRKSRCTGPRSAHWSPDSFAFGFKRLWTQDDQPTHQRYEAGTFEAFAADSPTFRELMAQVQGLVEGGL